MASILPIVKKIHLLDFYEKKFNNILVGSDTLHQLCYVFDEQEYIKIYEERKRRYIYRNGGKELEKILSIGRKLSMGGICILNSMMLIVRAVS